MDDISIYKSGFQDGPKKEVPLKDREYACIYLRVSTSRQEEFGQGIPTQKKYATEYCRNNQLLIYDYYTDVISGTEGSLTERKEYFRMLEDCEKHGIKKVVVFDVSRLFRDRESAHLVKRALTKIGVDIRSVSQQSYSIFDDHDPSAHLLNSLTDAIVSYERLSLVRRLHLSRKKKAETGYAGGGLSTGITSYKGQLQIVPEQLRLVRIIFHLKKKGFSPYGISKFLNERGIKSKRNKSFYPRTIIRILKNPIYKKGKIKFEGRYYDSTLGKLL